MKYTVNIMEYTWRHDISMGKAYQTLTYYVYEEKIAVKSSIYVLEKWSIFQLSVVVIETLQII